MLLFFPMAFLPAMAGSSTPAWLSALGAGLGGLSGMFGSRREEPRPPQSTLLQDAMRNMEARQGQQRSKMQAYGEQTRQESLRRQEEENEWLMQILAGLENPWETR